MHENLAGIYAAALTPLKADFSIALSDISPFLEFLSSRGCHGALLFGTTGEGSSFAPSERLPMMKKALEIRVKNPNFRLLAGTGIPSLTETVQLTKAAFEIGFDGVVVLPPYYYKSVTMEGLFNWYSYVIDNSVPPDGALLGYHIPAMTGVGLSIELLIQLKEKYPHQFAGIKDSSGEPDLAIKLGETFGKDLLVLNGNDRLLSLALQNSASGCITALANLRSLDSRQVWDAHQKGEIDNLAQTKLISNREVMERYLPAPPLLKAILSRKNHLPRWTLKPPLMPLPIEIEDQAVLDFAAVE